MVVNSPSFLGEKFGEKINLVSLMWWGVAVMWVKGVSVGCREKTVHYENVLTLASDIVGASAECEVNVIRKQSVASCAMVLSRPKVVILFTLDHTTR